MGNKQTSDENSRRCTLPIEHPPRFGGYKLPPFQKNGGASGYETAMSTLPSTGGRTEVFASELFPKEGGGNIDWKR